MFLKEIITHNTEEGGERLEVEMLSLDVSLQIKYSISVCCGREKAMVILAAVSENISF